MPEFSTSKWDSFVGYGHLLSSLYTTSWKAKFQGKLKSLASSGGRLGATLYDLMSVTSNCRQIKTFRMDD